MQPTTNFRHFTPLKERNIKIKVLNQNSFHIEKSIGNGSLYSENKLNQSQNQVFVQQSRALTQGSTDAGDYSQKKQRSISQYLNTEQIELKQNSAIYVKTDFPNIAQQSVTQDINQFRIKKQVLIKTNRPKSSFANRKQENKDLKYVTKQSIINSYIQTQYGQIGIRESSPKLARNMKKSKSKKRNEKSQKRINISQNIEAYNLNKSAADIDKRYLDGKRIKQSGGFLIRNQGINKKYLQDAENQLNEIQKYMSFIDDKFQNQTDSIHNIYQEINDIDRKLMSIEQQIRLIYQTNTEHDDTIKIQSCLILIKSIQNRIQYYQENQQQQINEEAQSSEANVSQLQEQKQINQNNSNQNLKQNFSNTSDSDGFKNKQKIHYRAQSQQMHRSSNYDLRQSMSTEQQTNYVEYVFNMFNKTIRQLSDVKSNQINGAFELILQLNYDLHKISNSQDINYNERAQALQYLYELDCQVPNLFNLLVKLVNNQTDNFYSIQEDISEYKSTIEKNNKEQKPNQFTIESPSASQKSFIKQAMMKNNQNQTSSNTSNYNITQDHIEESIQQLDNSINQNKNSKKTSQKNFYENNHSRQKSSSKSIENKSSKKLINEKQVYTSNPNLVDIQTNSKGILQGNNSQQNDKSIKQLDNNLSIKDQLNNVENNSSQVQQNYSSFSNSKIEEAIESEKTNKADIIEHQKSEIKSINISEQISNNSSFIIDKQQENKQQNNQLCSQKSQNQNLNDKNEINVKQDSKKNEGIGKSKSEAIQNQIKSNEDQLIMSKSEQINLEVVQDIQHEKIQNEEKKISQIDQEQKEQQQKQQEANDLEVKMKTMFTQMKVLIDHQNKEYSQQIIKQFIEFLHQQDFKEKQKIIEILNESLTHFNKMIGVQAQLNQIFIQYDQFIIDNEMYWNAIHFTHTHKRSLEQIRSSIYQQFKIRDLIKEDPKLKEEIKDFLDLRNAVLKLSEKSDFPLLNIALPNNLNVEENIIEEMKQRRFQTIQIIKEIIEIIQEITIICQRNTFSIYKLITFNNSFYTHADRVLSLLNVSTTPHLTIINLLDTFNKLKKLFQKDKQVSKLKQIVDRLLYIRIYDELVNKNFKQLEQELINSIQRKEIKLKVLEQRLKRLFSSTNEIRIILLDNNYDFNRIDNFRSISNQYVQLIQLYTSIYNTNESSFITGRDQAFELVEQLYSYMFFTKSLSSKSQNYNKIKSSVGQNLQLTQISQSQDSFYYQHIKKIPQQKMSDIKKRIHIYQQQLKASQETLFNFIQQHQQQLPSEPQERQGMNQEQQNTPPQIQIKQIFQKNLIELQEQLEHLNQQIEQILTKQQIQIIDLLYLVQGITEYLIEKKEDIAILQNNYEATIFTMPYNFGADCQMIIQQFSNFMHHNCQQNIDESVRTLTVSSSNTDYQAPSGPIIFNYSQNKPDQLDKKQNQQYFCELFIYNNYVSDSFCLGEILVQNILTGQIIYSDQIDTSQPTFKITFQADHPYLIVNIKYADYKLKQSTLFSSDTSIIEFSKKDLISNEKIYKIVIQATDPTSILRQQLQFFIHAKSNTQNEYIINKDTSDHNYYVQQEINILPTSEIITLTIKQNNQFEYNLYANLISSDTFQVFKNGQVVLNQINITQIKQDNPHSWKVFQIPKIKQKSQLLKKKQD
ncbi:hypothetical protein TTHERM_000575619 (macronuclear) [Tetrahymena thermophila SB210]|uniref:Uncharacterized protein n=1 Tax=Tetrahymena thermophila (strain SB210) TaxID=312017 RepID=W7XDS8_TETTS|nr:hypothetical protein TTHERM_000575619 [Tetrahymena thermophila SB210]EWS75742.1 hypothetical protein TTHERM_000575619 [Tetrahymena thermophila SB210]|eukprot:XP_012651664.1 hypothetical protein TTHERM_000575619 [Tetrahymena thermophila SB210]